MLHALSPPSVARYTLGVEQYEALTREKYQEPIDGKFEDATASIFEGLKQPQDEESSEDSELELEVTLIWLF